MLSDHQTDLLRVSLGADNFRWETPRLLSFICRDLGIRVSLCFDRNDFSFPDDTFISIYHYPTMVIFHQGWIGHSSILKELERVLDVVIFGS